jgi:hypothetical protein
LRRYLRRPVVRRCAGLRAQQGTSATGAATVSVSELATNSATGSAMPCVTKRDPESPSALKLCPSTRTIGIPLHQSQCPRQFKQ